MDTHDYLRRLVAGEDLTREDARALFDTLMEDRLEQPVMAALLTALAAKGECVDEIVGAAEAMRARVARVATPPDTPAIDTCGTGGDGKPTFNVSTAAAIVAAAAGATVAKHGNRSNARPSGSAEALAELGVNVDTEIPVLERCLRECRVAFLYAIRLHPAMKHAAPVRRAMGVRTIFNLVGPLTNPAGVRRQVLGVNRPKLVETMLTALQRLGAERAMVVHGLDGLCDLSVSAPTLVGWWDGQAARIEEVDCRVIDAEPAPLESVLVGSPAHSAALIRDIFDGARGSACDMVVFNAAAALQVAGLADDWAAAAERARAALESGGARETLESWVRTSQGHP